MKQQVLYCDYKDIIKDIRVDVIITDPPYTMQFTESELDDLIQTSRGNVVMFCSPKHRFIQEPDETGYWIKTPSTKNYSKHIGNFVEEIQILRRCSTFNMLHWSQMTGVWDDRLIYKTAHPWQKPLSLIERLVRIYTNEGDLVFDPFAGSGTTGVACQNLNRNFLGCESDGEYFNMATERIISNDR